MQVKNSHKQIAKLMLLLNISILFSSLCYGFLMSSPAMAKGMDSSEQNIDVVCQHSTTTGDFGLNQSQEIMPCCYQKNEGNKEAGLAYQPEFTRLLTGAILNSDPVAEDFQVSLNLKSSSSPPPEQALLETVVKKE